MSGDTFYAVLEIVLVLVLIINSQMIQLIIIRCVTFIACIHSSVYFVSHNLIIDKQPFCARNKIRYRVFMKKYHTHNNNAISFLNNLWSHEAKHKSRTWVFDCKKHKTNKITYLWRTKAFWCHQTFTNNQNMELPNQTNACHSYFFDESSIASSGTHAFWLEILNSIVCPLGCDSSHQWFR